MPKHFSIPAVSVCLFMFFISGCSSLHVDIAPTLDWNGVSVVEFQTPAENHWHLNQPLKSGLQSLAFQVVDSHPHPDLLFSYFVQESPDLTVESEVLVRLKSLHIQFIDPATKARVAAADYFYPETTDPVDPETGVRELFAALRQQILKENRNDVEYQITTPGLTQPATPELATPSSAVPTAQAAQRGSEVEPDQDQTEAAATGKASLSSPAPQSPGQEAEISTSQKPAQKAQQAEQKTRSPWVPRFKSWGFENWGEDSVDDY